MKPASLRLPEEFRFRRYLVPFDLRRLVRRKTDVLIVGSGVAGLRAALEARRFVPRVTIITKAHRSESNSYYAQGGVAAAIGAHDSVDAHIEDTVRVGFGLSDERMVGIVINEGVECVRELIDWGVKFDRVRGQLAFAREGGHGLARVLHRGDETGMEMSSSLLQLASRKGIDLVEDTFLVDLLTFRGACLGALCLDRRGRLYAFLAKRTILATGGAGQVFRETTNPPVATGDGIAAAFRAGAELMDMEFYQFHPTVLYIAGASRALISEAVRGAGATLRDRSGHAFMKEYHPMGDLAPRDVVSRSILNQMIRTNDTQVYLDARHLKRAELRRHFPGLFRLCSRFGLDPLREMIPVRPAAHYMIGGIRVDEFGQTTVRNLYAAGECAASGFHGANRLASNSLLECLVFGRRAGRAAGVRAASDPEPSGTLQFEGRFEKFKDIDLTDLTNSLRSLMWRNVGIERDAGLLREAVDKITFWSRYIVNNHFDSPGAWELQNMMTVSLAMACTALEREESRGVHYRSDYPQTDDRWRKHLIVTPR